MPNARKPARAARTKPSKTRKAPPPPKSPDELHLWLRENLEIHLPRTPVIDGHAAPFDYLTFAFFEGRSPASADGANASGGLPHSPTDCVVWANRAGGKTFLGAIATLLDLLYKPTIAVRVLAGSLDQSHRMLAYLHSFFDQNESLRAELRGRQTAGRIQLRNGSHVEVLAQSQTSVRGTHVQKLRCDEVDLFDPDIWDAAQFVTQSKVCDGQLIRGSVECLSTMQNPHGLMYRLLTEAQEGKRKLFKWGALDVLEHCAVRQCEGWKISGGNSPQGSREGARRDVNATPPSLSLEVLPYGSPAAPCPLLPECKGVAKRRTREEAGHVRIEDAIAKKGRVSLESWETEMLCARPRRTDAVIPEFNPKVHVFDAPPPRQATWFAGIDFGMRAPTAIVWAAVDVFGVLRIFDERYVQGCVLDDHVAAMRAGLSRQGVAPWPAPHWVAADPAGNHINPHSGVSDAQVLRNAGFTVRTPAGQVERGLSLIRARLNPAAAPPRLFIHRRCTNLIRSLTEYRYKPGDLTSLEPMKDGNDHAVDALRYLVMSLDAAGESRSGNYLAA